MPGALAWGYEPTSKVWLPIQVDANGKVKVDMSAINLDDLGDVAVAAPDDGDVLAYSTALGLWIPLTHIDLTTGAHGVTKPYFGESTVQALDLAAHVSRHRKGGGDPLSPFCLPDMVNQSNFIVIPVNAGWTSVVTGTGSTSQEPMRQRVIVTDAGAGSALLHAAAFGFNIGSYYHVFNYDKHLYIIFNYVIYHSEANLTRRIQLKEANTLGQLAQRGVGFQVVDLAMTGEAYGTSRGTVALGDFEVLVAPHYKVIQVIIELDPDTPAVNFYINGSLAGSITDTDNIPSGIGGVATYLVNSIDIGSAPSTTSFTAFMFAKIWQEF